MHEIREARAWPAETIPDMHRISPPLRQQQLGLILRELRIARGWTLEEVSEKLRASQPPLPGQPRGWSTAKVGRVETAKSLVQAGDVADLLDVYDADADTRRTCRELILQARSTPWWKPYRDVLGEYVAFETEAIVEQSWQPLLIPGLFQTADYAREVFRGGLIGEKEPQISKRVLARIARQRLLDCEDPVQFEGVISEQTLTRVIGDADVMTKQLDKLIFMMTWPNIQVRVLMDSVGAHPGLSGPFVLLKMPAGRTTVFFETSPEEILTDSIALVREFERRFEWLAAKALTPGESADFVAKIRRTFGADQ